MNEIVEQENSGEVTRINVGDENSSVSIKVYQDVYHQITGRTEKIRRKYSDNILVEFEEIEQLHHKILQLCDVHNIIAKNVIATVFYEKDRKEQFTSFDRFKMQNSSSQSPTLNLLIKYNFSILLPELKSPQEYTITVKLNSRVASINELSEESPAFLRGNIFRYIVGDTAEISVEYADYVIARGFLEAFDEWIKGCKKTPKNKKISFLQRHSHMFPQVGRVFLGLLTVFFSFSAISGVFENPVSQETMVRYGVVFVGGFMLLMHLGWSTFKYLEESVDSYVELSYLKLNRGDENLISKHQDNSNRMLRKAILAGLVTLILGYISSKLAMLI